MPIEPDKALGYAFPSAKSSYHQDKVILYHLGIGAGVPATDPGELEYTYEKNLKVLPSFGVIPIFGAMGGVMGGVPGLKFNPMLLLHGEQDIEIHRTLPVAAKLESEARIAGLYDKGKAALAVLEVATKEEGGAPLFTNRFSLFLRGEGGFGGERGPDIGNEPPERKPDLVVESPTLPQQALLYRLSGDKNPLHADPDFAKIGGFDTPDPPRALLVRDRLQGGRGPRPRRRRGEGGALPGALPRRVLPRRDDGDVDLARGEQAADLLGEQGARARR